MSDLPGRGAWGPWALGIAAAVAASVIHWALNAEQILGGLSDTALLFPLGLRETSGGLFANDAWLGVAASIFSRTYSYLSGWVLAELQDPILAARVLALPFFALFLTGLGVLARTGAATAGAGRIAIAWTLLPVLLTEPFVVAALEPLGPANHSRLAALTLAPGAALPRDLVFGLFPLLWLLGWKAWDKGVLATGAWGVLVGLLANVHPLTALHLTGFSVLAAWSTDPRAGSGRLVAAVGGFLAGAAPFIWQYLHFPSDPGHVPAELLAWRVPGIGGETLTHFVGRMEPLFWLWAAVAVLVRAAGGERSRPEDRLLRGAAWASLIAAVGPFVTNSVSALQGFQPQRLGRFAAVLLVILGARLAAFALRRGDRLTPALALCIASVVVLAPPAVRVAAGGGGQRGPFEAVARRIERYVGTSAAPALPEGLVARETPGDPSRPKVEGAGAAFLDVCRWARAESPREAIFLVPPEEWGAFRAYAWRPVAVTRKEGGFALSFLGLRGVEWFEQYSEAVRTYAEGDAAAWQALAERHGAAFVVADPGAKPPDAWPVVHTVGPYTVHRVD
jgi:uncharacterized protein DUF6798